MSALSAWAWPCSYMMVFSQRGGIKQRTRHAQEIRSWGTEEEGNGGFVFVPVHWKLSLGHPKEVHVSELSPEFEIQF